jgi:hypothetical protein
MSDDRTDRECIEDLERRVGLLERRVGLLESIFNKVLDGLRTVAGIYRKVTRNNQGNDDKSE